MGFNSSLESHKASFHSSNSCGIAVLIRSLVIVPTPGTQRSLDMAAVLGRRSRCGYGGIQVVCCECLRVLPQGIFGGGGILLEM